MAIIICIIFAPDKLEGRISEMNKKNWEFHSESSLDHIT